MKSDLQLREEVQTELDWDPSFDSRNIGVAVKDGIATLTGHVNAYSESWAAQKAAQKISGVKAVANELEVKLASEARRSDTDIAESAVSAVRSNVSIPAEAIKLSIHDGWLSLQGQVHWHYQKAAAEAAVRHLRGVRGISNNIAVKAPATLASAAEVKRKIESAFQRHAHRDAEKIRVSVAEGAVTLEGEVPTWQEREEAEAAAWAAPGVSKIDDRLIIRPF